MHFSSIIGQPLAVSLCQRWLEKGSTNPLLFYGFDGIGKRTLALEVAKQLNCDAKTRGREDGESHKNNIAMSPSHHVSPSCPCNSCHRIAAGNHPDVHALSLASQAVERKEPLEKQHHLRIETILNERRRLFQSPLEGPWKVCIVDDAHLLTMDAANALLKVLEEPPEKTAIFLLTSAKDRLLGTIQSRCQPVRCRSLNDEEMHRCLTSLTIPEENQTRLLEMALGSPGKALQAHREDDIHAITEAEHLWEKLSHLTPAACFGQKLTRAQAEEKLAHLLIPARRALHAGNTKAPQAIQTILRAQARLRSNVQPTLAYEDLVIQLASLRQREARSE